jgi:hypothetical protein
MGDSREPLETTYAVELITVNAAQLADWHGIGDDEVLRLDGPCPACGHDAPNVVTRRLSHLESDEPESPGPLTLKLDCTCNQSHGGRPANTTGGCGRTWFVSATADAGGVTLAPTAADVSPELAAALEAARDAGLGQVNDVRAAAEKWIGGVTAIFSLFGLAGVTLTQNAVSNLAITWKLLFALTVLAAIMLAGLAVFRIYQAAYGWPTIRLFDSDLMLIRWYRDQQKAGLIRAEHLKVGVRAAGGCLAGLVVAVGLLWFAPRSATPLTQVTLSNGSVVCGTLLPVTPDGTSQIKRASDGVTIDIPLHSVVGLTAVSSC